MKINPYEPPRELGPPPSKPAVTSRFEPIDEVIFEKVAEALVDALGVDRDEITPEASLVLDLGMC